MDTPLAESNAPLSINEAASFFDSALSGTAKEPEKTAAATPSAVPVKADAAPAAQPDKPVEPQMPDQPETVDDPSAQEARVTIEVDGKTVELTPQQIADAYKNGLRQKDYTEKTMATAEQRKAADAEIAKARDERARYAQGLQQAQSILQAQLHEQSQTINWNDLLENNPQEYLKQRHLADARQAKLIQVQGEQQRIFAQHQAEQTHQFQTFFMAQQDALLAKLPEWKDETKAKAEGAQIKDYLKTQGYEGRDLDVVDHRAVVLAYKAMKYDELMGKAQAAAKKVSTLPQKVERPGGGETTGLDGRTAVWKRFEKSGSVRDAASVFASLL